MAAHTINLAGFGTLTNAKFLLHSADESDENNDYSSTKKGFLEKYFSPDLQSLTLSHTIINPYYLRKIALLFPNLRQLTLYNCYLRLDTSNFINKLQKENQNLP